MIIKRTGSSKSAKSTLQYIEPNSNKAHKNNNNVTKRNLLKIGIGCRTDTWQHTLSDFRNYSNQNHFKIKTYNFVLSPRRGDFNPNSPEDVYKFGTYATDFARKAFPDHQVLIAEQNDNTRGLLHAHLIVNNTNIKTGKALPSSERNIYRLRRINDGMVKQYNHKHPTAKIYDFNKHYYNASSRQNKIITILHSDLANQNVKSLSQLRKSFKDNDITMRVCRPRKRSKYNHQKVHNKQSRGVVFKINNGKGNKMAYIRLSSLTRFYKKKYHSYINYGLIKHTLAKHRLAPRPNTNTVKQINTEFQHAKNYEANSLVNNAMQADTNLAKSNNNQATQSTPQFQKQNTNKKASNVYDPYKVNDRTFISSIRQYHQFKQNNERQWQAFLNKKVQEHEQDEKQAAHDGKINALANHFLHDSVSTSMHLVWHGKFHDPTISYSFHKIPLFNNRTLPQMYADPDDKDEKEIADLAYREIEDADEKNEFEVDVSLLKGSNKDVNNTVRANNKQISKDNAEEAKIRKIREFRNARGMGR